VWVEGSLSAIASQHLRPNQRSLLLCSYREPCGFHTSNAISHSVIVITKRMLRFGGEQIKNRRDGGWDGRWWPLPFMAQTASSLLRSDASAIEEDPTFDYQGQHRRP
jgi:hypothetical protein